MFAGARGGETIISVKKKVKPSIKNKVIEAVIIEDVKTDNEVTLIEKDVIINTVDNVDNCVDNFIKDEGIVNSEVEIIEVAEVETEVEIHEVGTEVESMEIKEIEDETLEGSDVESVEIEEFGIIHHSFDDNGEILGSFDKDNYIQDKKDSSEGKTFNNNKKFKKRK